MKRISEFVAEFTARCDGQDLMEYRAPGRAHRHHRNRGDVDDRHDLELCVLSNVSECHLICLS